MKLYSFRLRIFSFNTTVKPNVFRTLIFRISKQYASITVCLIKKRSDTEKTTSDMKRENNGKAVFLTLLLVSLLAVVFSSKILYRIFLKRTLFYVIAVMVFLGVTLHNIRRWVIYVIFIIIVIFRKMIVPWMNDGWRRWDKFDRKIVLLPRISDHIYEMNHS